MTPSKKALIQKNLLSWYARAKRDLPWRRTKDPYKIWVSEIMLQQTQVKTVIPYYEKWLKRFPTVKSLAETPLEEVLKHWAGLGYYRRARMLHEGAKFLHENQKGKLPETVEGLLKVPGIGRYTAGAIASIAFNKKAPIVDGNVIRILSRITALKSDINEKKTMDALWDLAEEVLPDKNTGDFNQAMMELGATICLPSNPSCLICPAAQVCEAFKLGQQEKFPVKKDKEVYETLETAALILRNNEKILVRKQPENGRWGGLWMFPHWKDTPLMLKETKLKIGHLTPRMNVKHGFTKYRINLSVYEANEKPGAWIKKGTHKWVTLKSLSALAFPAPHQKIVKHLLEHV